MHPDCYRACWYNWGSIGNAPEIFNGLELSEQSAFWGQKALLAGIITLLFSHAFFEFLHFLKRNI